MKIRGKRPGAKEPVWQPRFPQVVFSGESRKSHCSNKMGNREGMWKSIFAPCHTDSKAPVEWLLIEGLPFDFAQDKEPHASTLLTAGLKPWRSTDMPAAGLEPRRPTVMPATRLKPWSATTSLLQRFPVEMCE
jgi:hypothetical protein